MYFSTMEEAEQNAALMAIIYLEGGITRNSPFCILEVNYYSAFGNFQTVVTHA